MIGIVVWQLEIFISFITLVLTLGSVTKGNWTGRMTQLHLPLDLVNYDNLLVNWRPPLSYRCHVVAVGNKTWGSDVV